MVRAFFAHHQGMSLVALANVLCDDVFVKRFHAAPRVQATELLLQERVPREAILSEPRPAESKTAAASIPVFASRRFKSPHTTAALTPSSSRTAATRPRVTHAGGGSSTWQNLAVTRLRDDRTSDPGAIASTCARHGPVRSGPRPISRPARNPMSTKPPSTSTKRRSAAATAISKPSLQVTVSPEDDVEVRRLSITNRGDRPREVEVTSYAEIVLARPEDDFVHPAFGKLFIETDYDPQSAALLFSRRPRSPGEAIWAFHVLGVEGRLSGALEWESDRARFIGRGRTTANPVALDGRALSGTVGAVLDPIAALRERVRLPPGAFVRVTFATGVATDRTAALALARKYRDPERGITSVLDGLHARAHHPAAPGCDRRPGHPLRSPGLPRVRLRRFMHEPGGSRASTRLGNRISGATASRGTFPSSSYE